jgi:GTP-binding protein EngB required for normal cell division
MEAVTVALIAAVGGILAALIQKTRQENKEDHGVVASLLGELHKDVSVVENKLDKHIDSHNTAVVKEVAKKVAKKTTVK